MMHRVKVAGDPGEMRGEERKRRERGELSLSKSRRGADRLFFYFYFFPAIFYRHAPPRNLRANHPPTTARLTN